MLESVDVEVDGGVEDGEEVTEAGGVLHPQGPVGQHILHISMVTWIVRACSVFQIQRVIRIYDTVQEV